MTWARNAEPAPYPAEDGVKLRLLPMPTVSPHQHPPEPPERRPPGPRKSPGDPDHCDRCLWSKSGCCSEHHDVHVTYNLLRSIG